VATDRYSGPIGRLSKMRREWRLFPVNDDHVRSVNRALGVPMPAVSGGRAKIWAKHPDAA
jgi:hypothetical protein